MEVGAIMIYILLGLYVGGAIASYTIAEDENGKIWAVFWPLLVPVIFVCFVFIVLIELLG